MFVAVVQVRPMGMVMLYFIMLMLMGVAETILGYFRVFVSMVVIWVVMGVGMAEGVMPMCMGMRFSEKKKNGTNEQEESQTLKGREGFTQDDGKDQTKKRRTGEEQL